MPRSCSPSSMRYAIADRSRSSTSTATDAVPAQSTYPVTVVFLRAVAAVRLPVTAAIDRTESDRSQRSRIHQRRGSGPGVWGDPLPPGPDRHEFQPAGQKASVFGIFPSTR